MFCPHCPAEKALPQLLFCEKIEGLMMGQQYTACANGKQMSLFPGLMMSSRRGFTVSGMKESILIKMEKQRPKGIILLLRRKI